jgi:equilibrative nucleoside transporter 1/2/3
MDRLRELVSSRRTYEPLDDEHDAMGYERAPFIATATSNSLENDEDEDDPRKSAGPSFSWIEYSVFFLLGVAMLWAW